MLSILFILVLNFCTTLYAQRGCLTSYTNYYIDGGNIVGTPGRASDCCALCQQNADCLAYTWEAFEGGTCWLKNDTGPLVKASIPNTISGVLAPGPAQTYSLIKEYKYPNFFDDWWFDTRSGKAFGFAQNADNNTAWQQGLVKYQNEKIYIGVDHTTVNPKNGRLTTRINSKQIYNSGLFIISLDHVPTGPFKNSSGWHSSPVWPIIMLTGDNATQGEYDLYMNFNPDDEAVTSVHDYAEDVYGTCVLRYNPELYANLSYSMYSGMAQVAHHGTANTKLNQAGGGIVALQWEHGKYLRSWFFIAPNIPADILSESPNPNPGTWGIPNGYYSFEDCNPEVVNNDYLTIMIAFCNPPVTQECQDIVSNPAGYDEAYYLMNFFKVFCRPNENCWTGNYTVTG